MVRIRVSVTVRPGVGVSVGVRAFVKPVGGVILSLLGGRTALSSALTVIKGSG